MSTPLLSGSPDAYGACRVSTKADKLNSTGYQNPQKMYFPDCITYVVQDPPSHKARNKLMLAAAICFLFTIAEGLGGYLSNSLAIFTDASHMTIDFVSYAISIVAIWIAKLPANKKMPFGWHRAEVIGALLSVFTIWCVTAVLLYLAIGRLFRQDYEVQADPMLITAALGVVVNIIMGFVLIPEDIWSSRDEDAPKERVNINVRAAFIHVLGDLIQSVGVLVAAVIIKFKPEWKLADPISTFFFALLVLITTFNILRECLSVLMEGTPNDVDVDEVERTLLQIPGVGTVHSLNVWALTTDKNILSVHLTVIDDAKVSYSEILSTARSRISTLTPIHSMTIQLEPTRTSCRLSLSESLSPKPPALPLPSAPAVQGRRADRKSVV